MFDSNQKQRLRDLAWRPGEPKPDYTKANVRLEAYTEELQRQYAELFHNKDTLYKRVFMDRPRLTIPHSSFVRDYHNSTLTMIESTQ
jgi:hypothetical protein